MATIEIKKAESQQDWLDARCLLEEFSNWRVNKLGLPGIQEELTKFPWIYGTKRACYLARKSDGEACGMVVLRQLKRGRCEGKRLYVKENTRGIVAVMLMKELIREARRLGFKEIVADTIPEEMENAVKLLKWLGFVEIKPYYKHPIEGTMFLGLKLRHGQNKTGFIRKLLKKSRTD